MAKSFDKPTRVWINQPSTLQPFHSLHGKVGIALTNADGLTSLYFTEGNLVSMHIRDTGFLETKNSSGDAFKMGISSVKRTNFISNQIILKDGSNKS